MRKTAITSVVIDDFKVPELLDTIRESTDKLLKIGDSKDVMQAEYDEAKQDVEDLKASIEIYVAANLASGDAKVTEAAISRAIKKALFEHEEYAGAQQKLRNAKANLDSLTVDWDQARYSLRALESQATLIAASLNYMGHAKAARRALLASLNED